MNKQTVWLAIWAVLAGTTLGAQLVDRAKAGEHRSRWLVRVDWLLYVVYGFFAVGYPMFLFSMIIFGLFFESKFVIALVLASMVAIGVYTIVIALEIRRASTDKIKRARPWFLLALFGWLLVAIVSEYEEDVVIDFELSPFIFLLVFAVHGLFLLRIGEVDWFEGSKVEVLSRSAARLVALIPVEAKGVLILFGWLAAWGFWQGFIFTDHDSPRALAAGFVTVGLGIRFSRSFWTAEDRLVGIEVRHWPPIFVILAVVAYFFGHLLP